MSEHKLREAGYNLVAKWRQRALATHVKGSDLHHASALSEETCATELESMLAAYDELKRTAAGLSIADKLSRTPTAPSPSDEARTSDSVEGGGVAALPPIERDESYNRDYIPIGAGYEVQTKGRGSSFRIAHKDDRGVGRININGGQHEFSYLETMAHAIHAERALLATPRTHDEAAVRAPAKSSDGAEPVAAEWREAFRSALARLSTITLKDFADIERDARELASQRPRAACEWHRIELGSDCFETACGHSFVFAEHSSPSESEFTHCCYCGKALVEEV